MGNMELMLNLFVHIPSVVDVILGPVFVAVNRPSQFCQDFQNIGSWTPDTASYFVAD